jgi:hypothetical protein
VERLCERALLLSKGEVEFDGGAPEAIRRYQKQLALEESPEEVGAGLREWGTGEVRVEGVQLMGLDGRPRALFVSGEPVTFVLDVVGREPVAAPVLSLEVRDPSGSLLGASQGDLRELGWDGSTGERQLRYSIDHLPLGEGEYQLSVALTDESGSLRYHRIDAAIRFEVAPHDGARGALRLEGEWSLADEGKKVEA